MIVRTQDSSRLLITQPDHAALSARIMRAWKAGGFPESGRRADMVAIEEHDNGWLEPDAAPMVEAGKVLDFMTAPDEARRAVWPRATHRLAGTPYAAALVAQHAIHVYRRYRGEKAWDDFFAAMETEKQHHLSAAGLRTEDELRRDYVFLRLGDLASLTFCCGWTERQADDSGSGHAFHLEGDRLIVSPDPFVGQEVTLSVRAREVPPASVDLAATYRSAQVVELSGTAVGR